MHRYITDTTASYQNEVFHPSTSQGMTAMAPPPLPRRASTNSYLDHNPNDDFGLQSYDFSIFLPPVYSAATPLLTPLDLLTPPEPLRPGSPLLEMQQNLLAMQDIISRRLLLAKEYGTSLAIEGAFRKAEWERGRERRMEQNRGTRSTRTSASATKNTPYIDWSPISAAAVSPASTLPSTSANHPRSRTTIPVMDPTSTLENRRIEHPNSYLSTSAGATQAASTYQNPFPNASDKVPLTIQYRVHNPLTGTSDPYHETLSVLSSIGLDELKQVIWIAIQNGNVQQEPGLHGWIQNLIIHWDVDKQIYHNFPPTTELRDEILESMLVCLKDVRGYDWIEVGVETP